MGRSWLTSAAGRSDILSIADHVPGDGAAALWLPRSVPVSITTDAGTSRTLTFDYL